MKKLIMGLALLAVAGGGGWLWVHLRASAAGPAEAPQTDKVVRGDIRSTVSATGRIVSNQDVEIKCKASGAVLRLGDGDRPLDVSDVVQKGDLLIELDPVDMQRLVDQAQVSLSASQARLEIANRNLEVARRNLDTERAKAKTVLAAMEVRRNDAAAKSTRMQELFSKTLASKEEAETAATLAMSAKAEWEAAAIKIEELKTQELALGLREQDVNLARTQVKTDQINLSIARDRLNDCRVLAPIDGVIATRTVQIGQIIASGVSNVGGGTTVLTLSDLSQVFVLAKVDESYVGKVQIGQDAEITADALPGQRFRGKVVRIATRGENVSNVVTFEVKIEVLGEQKKLLKPEMTANVEIVTERRKDALLVPSEATARRGRKQFAMALGADGAPEEREVKLGISNGSQTEVLSGLAEGEIVVVRSSAADGAWSAQPARPPRLIPGGGRRR